MDVDLLEWRWGGWVEVDSPSNAIIWVTVLFYSGTMAFVKSEVYFTIMKTLTLHLTHTRLFEN